MFSLRRLALRPGTNPRAHVHQITRTATCSTCSRRIEHCSKTHHSRAFLPAPVQAEPCCRWRRRRLAPPWPRRTWVRWRRSGHSPTCRTTRCVRPTPRRRRVTPRLNVRRARLEFEGGACHHLFTFATPQQTACPRAPPPHPTSTLIGRASQLVGLPALSPTMEAGTIAVWKKGTRMSAEYGGPWHSGSGALRAQQPVRFAADRPPTACTWRATTKPLAF